MNLKVKKMHGHILTAETGKSKCGGEKKKLNRAFLPLVYFSLFLQGFDIFFNVMGNVMILGELIKKFFLLARENQQTSSPPKTPNKLF